jgi:hypothetical protein
MLSPALIRLALALLPTGQLVVVALDTTRLGSWEVWLAGIVVAGRTLPIGWAVLPSPCPKGRCRATTLALLQQLQRAFPAGGRWRLVVRWRAAATIGRGTREQPLVPAAIVVRAAVVTPPRQKQNPGTARERAKRAQHHAQHRQHKPGRKTTPPSAAAQRYAQTWVLCTTAPTVAQAVAEYAQRRPIEETFRDWHRGWGMRAAVVDLPTAAMVGRLNGGVCITYSLQMPLGPAAEHGPGGQAAAGAMDRDGPGGLALVRPTAV